MTDTTTDTTNHIDGLPEGRFTEGQARDYLAKANGERPPIRILAKTWGWSPAKVGRFTKEVDEVRQQPLVSLKNETSTAPSQAAVDTFEWGDESTVLPDQGAVAVYFNKNDDLVIRQERSWCDDEDQVVIVRKDNIDAFLDKLTAFCGVGSVGKSQS